MLAWVRVRLRLRLRLRLRVRVRVISPYLAVFSTCSLSAALKSACFVTWFA